MGRGPSEPEPEALDIEFMPFPIKIVKTRNWRWERLLQPVRAAPGSPARIKTHAKIENAKKEVQRIKLRLRETCPYEKWEFRVLHINGTEANVGIFACYRGVMSETERHEDAIRRKQYSERGKKAAVTRALKKQVADQVDNIAMIRPNPSRARYR